MVDTETLTLFLPSAGRSISDEHWQEIDSENIKCWSSACSELRIRSVEYAGAQVSVEFDWTVMLAAQRSHFETMEALHAAAGTPEAYRVSERFSFEPIKVPVGLAIETDQDKTSTLRAVDSVVESFVYDAFLIMNISAPGCFNLYTASLHSADKRIPGKIDASEFYFDLSRIDGRDERWPLPKVLPLESVKEWFFRVRDDVAQVPRNPTEKVLFAMLHISRMDLSPMVVIWIFYALETLFDTRAGENLRVLTERIRLLLKPNSHEAKLLKKELRKLYDLRSSLVHGGLEVTHPMHNEALDSEVEEKYARLSSSAEFGFRVLLCVVQSLVERGSGWPRFEEVLRDS